MPGRSTSSKPLQYVGIAVALIAVVGSVALGWDFGGSIDPLPAALGVAAAGVAIGAYVYWR